MKDEEIDSTTTLEDDGVFLQPTEPDWDLLAKDKQDEDQP